MTNAPEPVPQKLKAILAKMEDQKKRKKEILKEAFKTSPVSDEILEHLMGMVGWDGDEVLSHHPGYKLNRGIESLRKALAIYHSCHQDLMTRLDEFDASAQDPSLFYRPRESELKGHEKACRKEIFSLSSAAMALVDLARHVTKKIEIQNLKPIRENFFDMNLHEFIRELRRHLHHLTFLDADWAVSVVGHNQTTYFKFHKEKILVDGEFNQKAKQFLRSQPTDIDVRTLFESYSGMVIDYYGWFFSEIENYLPPEVIDYRRCFKKWKAFTARSFYRVVFSQGINSGTDLYRYLPDYLMMDELEEINRMPHRSKEQIDCIIKILDTYEACDEELRGLIYKGFQIEL